MTQEERWMIRYKEVASYIEANHRNPSRHRIEEHDMLNWVKANRRENAENVEMLVSMYGRMSEIYGADIQAMDQLIITALQKPEKDDEAVIALYDTDFYKRRFEGRGLYCLNDRDAFYKKYDSLDRRMWFLLNQDSHLANTYIPSIAANVQTFSVLSSQHPNSKVVAFFRDFFKEQLNELMDYQVWVGTMLVETVENNPEGVKSIIKNEINR